MNRINLKDTYSSEKYGRKEDEYSFYVLFVFCVVKHQVIKSLSDKSTTAWIKSLIGL